MNRSLIHNLSFESNGVFVLDLLGDVDLQTARRLYEELDVAVSRGGKFAWYEKIRTVDEFNNVFVRIESMCRQGFCPVIHVEGHGSRDLGLCVGGGDVYVSWSDLNNHLRKINSIIGNNLGVFLAACYGAYPIFEIEFDRPSPYYFLVGPVCEQAAGEIEILTSKFYKIFLGEKDFDKAFAVLGRNYIRHNCEVDFSKHFSRFLVASCTGKGRVSLINKHVTRAIGDGYGPISEVRTEFKKMLSGKNEKLKLMFEQEVNIFLHGRKTIGYEDVCEFALGGEFLKKYLGLTQNPEIFRIVKNAIFKQPSEPMDFATLAACNRTACLS